MRIIYPLLWARLGRQACREQTVNTVAALARRGHEVTLLMPRGSGDPELGAEALRRYFAVEGDFALVQRSSAWAGERLPRTLLWLRQVFRDPALRNADLLYSRVPAMLGMGGLSPLPFATDHYRPWPDEIPAIRPLLRRTSRAARCLGLILHSGFAAEAYRRSGVDPEKILVAHNGAASAAALPIAKDEARARLGLPAGQAIAVYAGRVNAQKGLDQLLALARLRPQVLFLIVGSEGDGPVEREAAAIGNVQVIPWVEPTALPHWLAAADVLLVPPSSAPLERFRNCVLPMKLFPYLAAGRAILAPRLPDTAELLEDEKTALLVSPGRSDEAAAALDRLLGEPDLAARLGAAARRLSSDLTWDRRAERISAFLEARLEAVRDHRSLYSRTVIAMSPNSAGAAQAPAAAER